MTGRGRNMALRQRTALICFHDVVVPKKDEQTKFALVVCRCGSFGTEG